VSHKSDSFYWILIVLYVNKFSTKVKMYLIFCKNSAGYQDKSSVSLIWYQCQVYENCQQLNQSMECEHFSNFRNRFIVTNLRERSNILKFKQIMSAYQKQNLEKLCKFIRNINKSTRSILFHRPVSIGNL
jgi:hypothetical protein